VHLGVVSKPPPPAQNFTERGWSFLWVRKHLGHSCSWDTRVPAAQQRCGRYRCGPGRPVPDKYAFRTIDKQTNRRTDKQTNRKKAFVARVYRIDCVDSLIHGSTNIIKLQRVQTSVARVVLSNLSHQPVTALLFELHWLPGVDSRTL